MNRKNVLHLIESSEPGGAETVLSDVARSLDKDRFRSRVCVLEDGWLTDHLVRLGIPFDIVVNTRPYDPGFLRKLVRLIKREKIDVMHSHEFMMTVYGAFASKLTGVPLVGTVHGKLYYPDSKRRIHLFKLALFLMKKLIAVSEDLRKFLVDELGFSSRKVVTLYNGIDLDRFRANMTKAEARASFSIPPDCPVAVTAGSLFKVKGLEYMLEAADELRKRYPDFILVIAGDGDQGISLKEKAQALGLGDTVRFLGFCDDIPTLLSAGDLYVCSSVSEGLSLSILEAMAMARPVVATDVGGNPELVIPGENGLLVSPREPSDIAQKASDLLDRPDLREKYGESGRKMVETRFSLRTMVQAYQSLYDEVTS